MEMIVATVAGIALGSLIGAVFLRAAAKWVAKLDADFLNAYLAVLLPHLAAYALMVILVIAMPDWATSKEVKGNLGLMQFAVTSLLTIGAIKWRLKLSILKSILVWLVTAALALAIYFAIYEFLIYFKYIKRS